MFVEHCYFVYVGLVHSFAKRYVFGVGGLKLWEGSLDLVKALRSEAENGNISFSGKRVLEVGL